MLYQFYISFVALVLPFLFLILSTFIALDAYFITIVPRIEVRNADIHRITPTSDHFRPSLSPIVSLSLGILHEWMRTQMLAKPSLNLLQRTGGDHRGGRAQLG